MIVSTSGLSMVFTCCISAVSYTHLPDCRYRRTPAEQIAPDGRVEENDPGSLVSYRQLSQKDYWITDPEDEDFGAIYTAGEEGPGTKEAVRLGEMKAFSNYGMILKPETEGDAYPALVVNCQQASTEDDTFSGIQLSQSHVRMLIQSIDQDTRIMIAGEVEDLEGM